MAKNSNLRATKKTKIWEYKDMDADHVATWSKGGSSSIKNFQMLC